jgi:hypothetical protein
MCPVASFSSITALQLLGRKESRGGHCSRGLGPLARRISQRPGRLPARCWAVAEPAVILRPSVPSDVVNCTKKNIRAFCKLEIDFLRIAEFALESFLIFERFILDIDEEIGPTMCIYFGFSSRPVNGHKRSNESSGGNRTSHNGRLSFSMVCEP